MYTVGVIFFSPNVPNGSGDYVFFSDPTGPKNHRESVPTQTSYWFKKGVAKLDICRFGA